MSDRLECEWEAELDGSGEVREFRAAQYVRMATKHRQYSTDNQSDKIRDYASKRGIEIVKTYTDEGKSGLSIFGRTGLQKLLSDVGSGRADFNLILVYDICRWGRFQNPDEGAYYEYVCRRAGIQVTYCAEQFENDGSSVSTIVKAIKQAMAGEYKREQSVMIDQAPDMPSSSAYRTRLGSRARASPKATNR
jgi:DNA invertase Pin-like site-specific DNA recombinase